MVEWSSLAAMMFTIVLTGREGLSHDREEQKIIVKVLEWPDVLACVETLLEEIR